MGVRVVAQYAVLDPYDFVTVIEAPDNETVAKVSMELGARGSVQMMTMAAIPVDTFIKNLAGRRARNGRVGCAGSAEPGRPTAPPAVPRQPTARAPAAAA